MAEVASGGPADKAGIQQGDIIIEIDGQDMTESSHLMVAIRDIEARRQVQVTIDRNGSTQDIAVTVEERPAGM